MIGGALGALALGCGPGISSDGGNAGGSSDSSESADGTSAANTTSTTVTTTSTGSTTSTDPTGNPTMTCLDWAPPPGECAERGLSRTDGSMDPFEDGLDGHSCRVLSVTSIDPTTDVIELGCDADPISVELTVTSDAPHLAPPLAIGQAAVLSTTLALFPLGGPSISLRDENGALILAYANLFELNLLESDFFDPLRFQLTFSGCPGTSVGEICDGPNEAIIAQRAAVRVLADGEPVVLFDGSQVFVDGGPAGGFDVLVERAQLIACWDEGCAGDDSGPFDELRMLVVRSP